MKLVLSTLKKMSKEENFKKFTKVFLWLLNERSWELKVMKIRKSKYCVTLTLSWRRPLSYRNQSRKQSIDLQSKSMDWFLYDNGLKGGEIFLNNALNWTKILQFLTTNSKNTQAVNKVECLKCKKEP